MNSVPFFFPEEHLGSQKKGKTHQKKRNEYRGSGTAIWWYLDPWGETTHLLVVNYKGSLANTTGPDYVFTLFLALRPVLVKKTSLLFSILDDLGQKSWFLEFVLEFTPFDQSAPFSILKRFWPISDHFGDSLWSVWGLIPPRNTYFPILGHMTLLSRKN